MSHVTMSMLYPVYLPITTRLYFVFARRLFNVYLSTTVNSTFCVLDRIDVYLRHFLTCIHKIHEQGCRDNGTYKGVALPMPTIYFFGYLQSSAILCKQWQHQQNNLFDAPALKILTGQTGKLSTHLLLPTPHGDHNE